MPDGYKSNLRICFMEKWGSTVKIIEVYSYLETIKGLLIWLFPAGIYLFKVTMKTPEQNIKSDFTHCSSVFIVDFEQVNAGWDRY